jgi:transcriptional antiterminator
MRVEYSKNGINMKDVLRQIVQVLKEHGGQMTAEAVADQLGCTDRYVRKTVTEEENTEMKYGFSIRWIFRKGYDLVISDPALFEASMGSQKDDKRAREVLADIIESLSYIKIDELADKNYNSRKPKENMCHFSCC